MKERSYTNAQLGMLAGIILGGGIGVILLAITGNAVYVAIAGAGASIGLVLGAGIDSRQNKDNDE